jgi:hypothetical protein
MHGYRNRFAFSKKCLLVPVMNDGSANDVFARNTPNDLLSIIIQAECSVATMYTIVAGTPQSEICGFCKACFIVLLSV